MGVVCLPVGKYQKRSNKFYHVNHNLFDMKKIFLGAAILATSLMACHSNSETNSTHFNDHMDNSSSSQMMDSNMHHTDSSNMNNAMAGIKK